MQNSSVRCLEALYDMVSNCQAVDTRALSVRSVFAAKRGNHHDAAELLGKCVTLEPGIAYYQQQLGRICAKMGWWKQAMLALNRAIYLDPYDAESWYGLGHVFRTIKQQKEAEFCFSQCLLVEPGFSKAIQALDGLH